MIGKRLIVFLAGGLLLFFGMFSTMLSKTQLVAHAPGKPGTPEEAPHAFDRPWFQSLEMFVAMAFVLGVHFMMKAQRAYKRRKNDPYWELPLRAEQEVHPHDKPVPWSTYFAVIVPATFDLIASSLGAVGLLFTTASVFQMLRGSMYHGTTAALLSICFLHKKLLGFHWLGITLVCIAMAMVGVASVMGDSTAKFPWYIELMGCFLIISAQLIQAAQLVVEEFLLRFLDAPPFVIVGMEGVWGTFLMVLVLMLYQVTPSKCTSEMGCALVPVYHEDTLDSFQMLYRGVWLRSVVITFMVIVALYNMAGMTVTDKLSAVHRSILESARILFVWIGDLFMYYAIGPYVGLDTLLKNTSAEGWNNWSFMQLGGFVFLLAGSFIYNDVWRVPGMYYPPPPGETEPLLPDDPVGSIQDGRKEQGGGLRLKRKEHKQADKALHHSLSKTALVTGGE